MGTRLGLFPTNGQVDGLAGNFQLNVLLGRHLLRTSSPTPTTSPSPPVPVRDFAARLEPFG